MKKYILLALFFIPAIIFAEEWHVKKTEKNLVKFISSTTLLDFEGITNNIGGKNEIYFEVDLNSVETGNGKRDRDMREDVLETDEWPLTSFKGEINEVTKSIENPNKFNVSALGKMFIHGHEKVMPIEAVIEISNNNMNVICDFSVLLKDYDIEAPSLLAFIKVADEIKLHLNFQLKKILEKEN